eukprot:711358-Hanusia_phi.AAC.7
MSLFGFFSSWAVLFFVFLLSGQVFSLHDVGVVIKLDAYEPMAYAQTLIGSLAIKQEELAASNLALIIDVFVVSSEWSGPVHGLAVSSWDAEDVACSAFLASLELELRGMRSKISFAEDGRSFRDWSRNKTSLLSVDLWLDHHACEETATWSRTSGMPSTGSVCFLALSSAAVRDMQRQPSLVTWSSTREKLEVWLQGPREEEDMRALMRKRSMAIRPVLLPLALNDPIVVEGWREDGASEQRRSTGAGRILKRRMTTSVFLMSKQLSSCELHAIGHSCRVVHETNKQNEEVVRSGEKRSEIVMEVELLIAGPSSLIQHLIHHMTEVETCSLLHSRGLLRLAQCGTKSDVRSVIMEHNVSVMMFVRHMIGTSSAV